jgi:hypothetical protein
MRQRRRPPVVVFLARLHLLCWHRCKSSVSGHLYFAVACIGVVDDRLRYYVGNHSTLKLFETIVDELSKPIDQNALDGNHSEGIVHSVTNNRRDSVPRPRKSISEIAPTAVRSIVPLPSKLLSIVSEPGLGKTVRKFFVLFLASRCLTCNS